MTRRWKLLALWAVSTLGPGAAWAAVAPVGVSAFGPASSLASFGSFPLGTEVNGLSFSGLSMAYSLGNGQVQVTNGPGVTNNLGSPAMVSTGNNTGVLSVALPGLSSQFGYGFALLFSGSVPNATTITLFNGATSVGSLSYTGSPDPSFSGGFAGISSTLPFNNVKLSFNATLAPAFALDNFRVTPVPEAPTALLLGVGGAALAWRRRAALKRV